MTEIPSSPAAGWYPDPQQEGWLRYWDGRDWGGRQPIPSKPGRVPQPVGPRFQALGGAVRVGVRLTLLVFAAQIALYGWGLSMFSTAVDEGDFDRLDAYDAIDLALVIASFITIVPTAVCWAIWQYRLARSARPEELRRGPGWHAFSWITPVVSFWFPYQNIRDLWVRRFPDRGRLLLGWWWAGWTAWIVLTRVYGRLYEDAASVNEAESATVLGIVATVVGLATGLMVLPIHRALSDAERVEHEITPAATPAG